MMYDRIDRFTARVEGRLGAAGGAFAIALTMLMMAAIYVRPECNYTGAGLWYEQLANNPFSFTGDNILAFRIMTPLISYLIGLRGKLFMVTNGIIALFFLGFVYRHFRAQYPRPADAFFATAILTFSTVVLVTIGYSGFCDILSYLTIFAMWHWRKNIWLYTLFFAVGLFNHENILFLLPWLIAIRFTNKTRRAGTIVGTIAGLVIVLVCYKIFRNWVASEQAVGLSASYYIQPLLDDPLHWMRNIIPYYGLGLFSVFKIFWIIPVVAIGRLWQSKRRREAIMIILPTMLSAGQLVIAYDTTRLFTLGFMTMVLSLEYVFSTDGIELRKWLPGLVIFNLFVPQLYTASYIIQLMPSTPMHLLRMWLEHKPWWP